MAPGPSRASRPPREGPPDSRQLSIRDDEIAVIFTDMRRACQLSREQLAVRLSTPVRTVEALENGTLLTLPEWPETSRVIRAYTGLLGLEAAPILRRIQRQLTQRELPHEERLGEEELGEEQPNPFEEITRTDPELVAGHRSQLRGEEPIAPYPRQRARGLPRLLPWALLLVILATTFTLVLAIQRPALVYSVIDKMPDPFPRLMRAGMALLQPVENDMEGTGVEGGSPDPEVTRYLKADKLPQANQSNN